MNPPLPERDNIAKPWLYELRDVNRSYGRAETLVRAIDGIDLRIGEGEFLVVAGPSGSGKSTLLQLLGALDRPTGGVIYFEGRDLSKLSDGALAELRLNTLGFIFQQFNLIPTLSARENVEVVLAPAGIDAAGRERKTSELLGRVGLADRVDHLPSQLSGGEQQRVAIARALANEPDVLLADEPTGNLDMKTGNAILGLLYRLWEETGVTVVLITHDRAIAETAPRVLRLADGRLTEGDSDSSSAAVISESISSGR
jgi:putative ABC transport system ATP-binding protein